MWEVALSVFVMVGAQGSGAALEDAEAIPFTGSSMSSGVWRRLVDMMERCCHDVSGLQHRNLQRTDQRTVQPAPI
jgi:hypothetical protein